MADEPFPEANCSTCPEPVIASLSRTVSQALSAVRSLNTYTGIFSTLTTTIVNEALQKLEALVDAIPDPLPITLPDLVGYLTCPLTPFALLLGDPSELAELDPVAQLERIRGLVTDYANQIRTQFEEALEQLEAWGTIRVFQGYLQAIKRFRFDEEAFAYAIAICAAVEATCEEVYKDSVFEEFVEATTDFSISGIVPAGLQGTSKQITDLLGKAELKLQGWSLVASGAFPV